MLDKLKAPFPWFGGKRKVAADVWARFGVVSNYVEPFFGSGAVLLGRPEPIAGSETVNDLDGFVANAWRAIKSDPEETAKYADNPVNENDLHARHVWLLSQRDQLRPRLEADLDWYDPKIAGFWLWGIACWIGSGFCSGKGPWQVVDGQLVKAESDGKGVSRKLVHLTYSRGVNSQLDQGVKRQRIHLSYKGQGVNRQLDHGDGRHTALVEWFESLAKRLERVRVCSGDWTRVCGPSVMLQGISAVFLDPPYADTANRDSDLYRIDSETVAHDVRAWAIENGKRPDMRIALCGYEGEHVMPSDWSVHEWLAGSGYNNLGATQTGNGKRERIWFSPACQGKRHDRQGGLFDHLQSNATNNKEETLL